MIIRFSRDGNSETKQSAKATAELVGSFGALARANSWYGHATMTDRIAPDRRRRLNQRRRYRQNYLPLVCEAGCVRIAWAVRQQNGLAGVTREEKASLGGSW